MQIAYCLALTRQHDFTGHTNRVVQTRDLSALKLYPCFEIECGDLAHLFDVWVFGPINPNTRNVLYFSDLVFSATAFCMLKLEIGSSISLAFEIPCRLT